MENGPQVKRTKIYTREDDPERPLTTGEVAQLCEVASRTVSKWFDSGRLKGHRVPGSKDRRIAQEDFRTFAKDNGLPAPETLVIPKVHLMKEPRKSLQNGGILTLHSLDLLETLLRRTIIERVVIVDDAVGGIGWRLRASIIHLCRAARLHRPEITVVRSLSELSEENTDQVPHMSVEPTADTPISAA